MAGVACTPKRLVTWLAIALVAAPASAQPRIGTPIRTVGEVSLARGTASRPLRLSQPLYPADVVATGERSYTRIGFHSGWYADIPAEAEADLAWSPEPDTIYVTLGGVRGMSRPGASPITMVSGVAEAVASATTFYFRVAPAGATSVLVDHGEVRFGNRAGATVRVTAGLASTVRAVGLPPTPPAPPPPALVQEANELATRAALETTPAEATPPESFRRLRVLREASRGALERTTAPRGSPDAAAPGTTAGAGGVADWLVPGIAAGIMAAVGTLVIRDLLDDDDDDDRPPRPGPDEPQTGSTGGDEPDDVLDRP